ncbi:F0F1 ATP synthase subunit B [Sphingomonas sp. ID0503]|uniref:F0F1 ATP synthase subunit B family protein n=1 Tax=Sphingomonas sp. ID0503 TaxID=3399691 RepID=UPI003AFA8029
MNPASAAAEYNLQHADRLEGMPAAPHGETNTTTEAHGEGAEHVNPTALGFDATWYVALAMVAVIVIMLIQKVPAAIGRALDKKIAGIRANLDESQRLREEAEALKAEYEAKAAAAEKEAADIRAHAETEAAALVAQAKVDAEALVERRTRMAEDKIGAAERAAVAEVRAKAADAAAKAAAAVISQHHDANADRALVDKAIAGLGRR